MKKLIILPFVLFSFVCFGQSRFVLQNQTTQVFSTINEAIAASNSGDTLYIPGGDYSISPSSINKTLHWVGVGHYPDSTTATLPTRIVTPLTFTGDCDDTSFEGIHFTGSLTFGSTGDDALNVSMKKCRVGGTLNFRSAVTTSADINFLVSESVLNSIDARGGANCLIEKSIINRPIYNFNNSLFKHNNFCMYHRYNEAIVACNSCNFSNNIFITSYGFYSGTIACVFSSNLFERDVPYDGISSSGNNNLINVDVTTIFTSIIGNYYDFSYESDYHLKAGCVGIAAASDGTDIGIYGSTLPYKEGAVPFYPHLRNVSIDDAATGGQLGVKITVAAQER